MDTIRSTWKDLKEMKTRQYLLQGVSLGRSLALIYLINRNCPLTDLSNEHGLKSSDFIRSVMQNRARPTALKLWFTKWPKMRLSYIVKLVSLYLKF